MLKTIATASLFVLAVGSAQAALLNFEDEGYTGDLVDLGTTEVFAGFDVTFSSANGLFAVKTGGPTNGFVPDDMTKPEGQFGEYFLSSDFGTKTSLSISYGTPVSAASFDVADIDGSGNDLEVFDFVARDAGGNVLASRTVKGNDPLAGNAIVTRIGFSGLSGLIASIDITGTTEGNTRKIGIAFDNFETTVDTTTPIPLPAGLPLAAAAFGALGLIRARRKT